LQANFAYGRKIRVGGIKECLRAIPSVSSTEYERLSKKEKIYADISVQLKKAGPSQQLGGGGLKED
jgi:hypothetical protein